MKKKDTLLFDKYHIYDALLVGGIICVIIALLFFASVFLGTLTMGRASVILAIVFLLAGSIMIGNGKVMKKTALGETDDFYKDYREEKRKLKENSDKK